MGTRGLRKFILSLSLAAALCVVIAPAVFAGEADLRPVWAADDCHEIPLNASMLYSNQNPNFVRPGFGSRVIGQEKVNELKQDYEDRNRDYDMRASYGIATQNDEMDHEQSMKDMGHEVINSARNAQTQQYSQNVSQAQNQGEIAKPILYTGGAVGITTGTPVTLNLGKDVQATVSANALARQSQVNLTSSDMTAVAMVDESGASPERYMVTVNRNLVLGIGSGVTYGGTSNTVSASLSRAIYGPLSASVGGMMPTNANNNPTGAVTQGTVGLNYGMQF